jgi:hypothetical protein
MGKDTTVGISVSHAVVIRLRTVAAALGMILFIGLGSTGYSDLNLSPQGINARASRLTTPRVRLQEGLGADSEMKERIETLSDVLSKKMKAINGLVFRNGGRGLIALLLKAVRGVRPKATKSVVKQVARFVFSCYRIAKHCGLKGLVLYLKASQVLLQQSVGGFRVRDLADLKVRPKRNRSGVPVMMIPADARRRITRDRDIPTIRL